MQRREFLAVASGALAATCLPSIPLAEAAAQRVDFSLFTAEYVGRKFDSSLPFVRDGWLFATDTRICIRQRTQAVDTLRRSEKKLPAVWNAEWPTDTDAADWRPWPKCVILFAALNELGEFEQACVPMRGRECPACMGDICAKCHQSEGLIDPETCWICGGIGINSFGRIAGRHISNEFLRKITELLPGPIEYLDQGMPGDALAFRWNGGDGLVMPIDIRPQDKIRALTAEQAARVRALPIKVYRDEDVNHAD